MNGKIPRRKFFTFSALAALSPLALLGIGKTKPDDSDVRVKRMYETKEYYRELCDNWKKVVNLRAKNTDYWCERALAAEEDLKDRNDSIDMAVHLLNSGRDKIDASEFLILERSGPYRHPHCMSGSHKETA